MGLRRPRSLVAQCHQGQLVPLGCKRKQLELDQGMESGMELAARLGSGLEALIRKDPAGPSPKM